MDAQVSTVARRRHFVLSMLPALVLVAASAPVAGAAVQIGQLPPAGAVVGTSVADKTWVQSSVGAVPVYAAPAPGVVTAWTTRASAGSDQMVGLRILRPDPADAARFTTVGSTPLGALTPEVDNTFAVGPPGITVAAGDVPAIRVGPSQERHAFSTPYSFDVVRLASVDAPPGTATVFSEGLGGRRLNLTVTIEPDADEDGLGDENQDSDDDGDGVADSADNCPDTATGDNADLDADGRGDACDDDGDGDGLADATEAKLGTDPRAADSDRDGVGDGADACPTLAAASVNGCPAFAPPAPTPTPTPDTTAPRISVAGVTARLARTRLLRTGIRARVTTSEPARLEASLLGRFARARIARAGDVVLAERTLRLGSGTRTVVLKPAARLARALARSLRLRLQIRARDAAGNESLLRRTVVVR